MFTEFSIYGNVVTNPPLGSTAALSQICLNPTTYWVDNCTLLFIHLMKLLWYVGVIHTQCHPFHTSLMMYFVSVNKQEGYKARKILVCM